MFAGIINHGSTPSASFSEVFDTVFKIGAVGFSAYQVISSLAPSYSRSSQSSNEDKAQVLSDEFRVVRKGLFFGDTVKERTIIIGNPLDVPIRKEGDSVISTPLSAPHKDFFGHQTKEIVTVVDKRKSVETTSFNFFSAAHKIVGAATWTAICYCCYTAFFR